MIRTTFAAGLLLVSGLAAAQQGGVIVTGPGGGDVGFVNAPATAISSPTITEFRTQVFVVTDLSGVFALGAQPASATVPTYSAVGEAPIVTLEEGGVRLPDEQFSIP